jgi:hypothetical protein
MRNISCERDRSGPTAARRARGKTEPGARRDPMNEAHDRLRKLLPQWAQPALRWLHSPRSRPVRIPLGILCIFASFFWFLPVIGLEFLPIGLLLLAYDVPLLRKPAGHLTLWLIDLFERARALWRRRLTMWRAHRRSSGDRRRQSEAR